MLLISKKTDITYSHVVNIINLLLKEKIVETRKEGRNKYVTLTEKGQKILNHIIEIREIINH